MSSSSSSLATTPVTRDDLDAAKANVHKCEDEIESIKRALGRFALGPQEDVSQPNRLDIAMLKWQGLPDELAPTPAVMLQLSSPVEEIRLDQLWDPLAPDAASSTKSADEASSKSVASFSGVETSMATLTVTVFHNHATSAASEHHHHIEAALGSSESMDVSLWCPLDAMNPQDVYQTEWPVIITKNPSAVTTTTTTTPSEEEPTINVSEEGEAKSSETGGVEESKTEETATATTSESSSTTTTLGTVTLRVTYKPSAKDQQEALYELLNKASQRKNLALEHLRQVSLQLSRTGPADARTSGGSSSNNPNNKKPTMKPGFLNHPTKKQPNRLVQWYQATLGPQSMARILFPVVKNYIIFFTAIVLFHYKGQELALPAPV